MKNDIIENIRLEMKNHKSRISISVHVGDVATRTLHITLADSGSLVTLENVLIAEILVEKPDGKHCYNNCVIAGDEIQYTITSQTINVIGICKCEIRLTFEDGEVVTSPEFTIVVYDKNLNQNVVKSQNEYTALTEQVVMAKNYAKEAAKSLESIGDAEANAAASAERAEKAEDLARGHLENAEAVRDSVAADANSAREAAQGATASEETAQKLAEEIRAAVSGAVEASENANVSAQNAANSEVNAKQYEANAKTASEGIEEALINAVASAERAEEAEESAEVYAE